MAQMTMTPVATHGFFWMGSGWRKVTSSKFARLTTAPSSRSVHQGRREHAEAAIAAAVKAFGTTRRLPAFERQRVLRQIADGIQDRKEEFARTLALEAGKPIKSARMEVDRAIFTFNIAAEETVRGYGEYLPLDWQQSTAGRWGIVKRFPLGPVAGITPFNFPLNLVAHKVAPAIAAGCSMVLKPAPADAAQLPAAGGSHSASGMARRRLQRRPALQRRLQPARDRRTHQAHQLHRAAPPSAGPSRTTRERKKSCSNWAAIPASSSTATPISPTPPSRCVTGGFAYAGQSCISVQRILVEQSVYGKFTELLLAGVSKLKVGDPLDESSDLGPLIRESDAIRAADWVQEAVRGGARLLCGGNRKGSLFEPTVLTSTKPGMKVNCQEIFAPVVTVEPYNDFASALKQVNNSRLRPAGGTLHARRQAHLSGL